jgi:uncharacterized protein (DUF1800 family)
MTLDVLRRHPPAGQRQPHYRWRSDLQLAADRSLARRWQAVPLRQRRPDLAPLKATTAANPPEEDRLVLNRATFGPTPEALAELDGMGATPAERRQSWVEWQLHPGGIPDGDLSSRLSASGLSTLEKDLPTLWTEHQLVDDFEARMLPILETQHAAVLRATYSRRQLEQVVVDFWHNHFNVYGWHDTAGPVFVHYDRDVIRTHALGNFRDFIEAMSASAAMLLFLDNAFNSADGPNENFARELLELHTLGENAYYGAMPAAQVPTGPDGVPKGYVDEDVRELARCLTGWSLDGDTGEFLFRGPWHDRGPKRVLGLDVPANLGPMEDVRRILDRLAVHPATARHVCYKLCQRLVADQPPDSLVESAVATFLGRAGAPDQLRQVVRTILLSDEIAHSWGGKIRRPFEIIIAALRGMGADFELPTRVEGTEWFLYLTYATGNLPHDWAPPTGYPDVRTAWLTTNALMASWRLVNLVTWYPEGGPTIADPLAATPEHLVTPLELADHWIRRLVPRGLSEADRTDIVQFMSQGRSPDLPLDRRDPLVSERIQSLVGLILLSPEFIWR